jgi:uncharacterized protein with HEPN domain
MTGSRDARILEQISDYCNDIEDAIARFGDSFACFQDDLAYRTSVAMYVFQAGELTTRLTDDFKTLHSCIPWSGIAETRTPFSINQGGIDFEALW